MYSFMFLTVVGTLVMTGIIGAVVAARAILGVKDKRHT